MATPSHAKSVIIAADVHGLSTASWDSVTSHEASLTLPSVKSALARAKPMLSGFEEIAITSPVWGVGLRTAERPVA